MTTTHEDTKTTALASLGEVRERLGDLVLSLDAIDTYVDGLPLVPAPDGNLRKDVAPELADAALRLLEDVAIVAGRLVCISKGGRYPDVKTFRRELMKSAQRQQATAGDVLDTLEEATKTSLRLVDALKGRIDEYPLDSVEEGTGLPVREVPADVGMGVVAALREQAEVAGRLSCLKRIVGLGAPVTGAQRVSP